MDVSMLESSPPLFAAVCAVVGLMVGSFLNVVIYRLPKMIEHDWKKQCETLDAKAGAETSFNLIVPRSRCDSCGHPVASIENIPVLSYIFLRGKCRHCGAAIPLRTAIIEAMTGIISGFVAWRFGFGMETAGALIFVWAMIALAFIDIDTQLLPDVITLPLLWTGLLFNLDADLHSAVIGAAAGYLSLWSIYWLFKLTTKKEGMGHGDFKLLAAIGAWLGWSQLPLVILASSVVGASIGILMILLAKQGRDTPIPFGPYLAGGGLIAMFWGKDIARAYLG
ncbi:MAG: A24 family peptidase [Burkholderiales bacterium]|nr:A24 family peptidase [Burkholderiales bacterium]